MGDLNENHDEFYRLGVKTLCALLPDDTGAAELAGNREDVFILSSEKPPEARFFGNNQGINGPPVFYTPWGNELSKGSYNYKKTWETIDHFLLSAELFDNTGWDFEDCRIVDQPPFTGTASYPQPYMPRNGLGMSDHLPLMLTLKRVPSK
jgi:hypothetical protein